MADDHPQRPDRRPAGRSERLARACGRHPKRTIGGWLAAIVVSLAVAALLLPGSLTTDGSMDGTPESVKAGNLIDASFPPDPMQVDEFVIVRSARATASDTSFRRFVAGLEHDLAATGSVARERSYLSGGGRALVSADGHAALLEIVRSDDVAPLIDATARADGRNGFSVSIVGEGTVERDFNRLSQGDLRTGELEAGLPAALLVLVLVFGALVAGLVPLLMALVSILVAIGLTALVGEAFTLSVFVVNMLSAMGLALGTDYSLFILSRFREERAGGHERLDAIGLAGATASRAVFFSGSIFVIALSGMLLVPSSVMRSLAVGAITVGAVSVLAALTLLPALLALLGDRVNALRLPLLARLARHSGEQRFWGGVVARVMRRPVTSFALTAGVLLLAATPLLGLRIGSNGIESLPSRTLSKQGYDRLVQSFPRAGESRVLVAVSGAVRSRSVSDGIRRLQQELVRDPAFGSAGEVRIAPGGQLAALSVPLASSAGTQEQPRAVERLRGQEIPSAFAGVDARVLVGGDAAENLDFTNVIGDWMPRVFVFVLGLSFLLLTLVFRSVVIAATSMLLNLLSVAASYGMLTLVFQHGVGASLLGFQQTPVIEAWVPLFLFSVLFGLSMDYQVFLLSRIRESYDRSGSTRAAVAEGVGSTARLITGAAVIIVVVFGGFALGDLVMFQQMGFGVAIALLIDATVVRSLLLPAAMALLGRWNWYLPRWLEWLPRFQVERQVPTPAAAPARS